jgi:hypothetical protein
VLSKLEWARLAGDSERQLADAAGVVARALLSIADTSTVGHA